MQDTGSPFAAHFRALAEHTGMTPAEADQAVTEWTNTYEQLQADLEDVKEAAATQAREAAAGAADALATVSLWAFAGFLLGALAAAGGGHLGGKSATGC